MELSSIAFIGDQQRSTPFGLRDVIALVLVLLVLVLLVTSDTLSLYKLNMIELRIHRVHSLFE